MSEQMEKIARLKRAVNLAESINTITMFVLPPSTGVYAIWCGDWRPFQTALVIGITVLVFGISVLTAKERAEKVKM